jgi:hypothetical protein
MSYSDPRCRANIIGYRMTHNWMICGHCVTAKANSQRTKSALGAMLYLAKIRSLLYATSGIVAQGRR